MFVIPVQTIKVLCLLLQLLIYLAWGTVLLVLLLLELFFESLDLNLRRLPELVLFLQ